MERRCMEKGCHMTVGRHALEASGKHRAMRSIASQNESPKSYTFVRGWSDNQKSRKKASNLPVNQNPSLLAIFTFLQALLNPTSASLKFSQQVLIINIININVEMFILVPVFKVLEVILQNRHDMGDAITLKC